MKQSRSLPKDCGSVVCKSSRYNKKLFSREAEELWSSRAGQIRTCRGKVPPSCLHKTVLLLKSPTGAFVASQTQTFSSAISGQRVLKSDGLGAILVFIADGSCTAGAFSFPRIPESALRWIPRADCPTNSGHRLRRSCKHPFHFVLRRRRTRSDALYSTRATDTVFSLTM